MENVELHDYIFSNPSGKEWLLRPCEQALTMRAASAMETLDPYLSQMVRTFGSLTLIGLAEPIKTHTH